MERSKDRAAAFFNSLPRNIRDVPLIEALIGVNGTDLLEAIFDVDVDEDHLEPLFSPDEDFFDRAQILTQQSVVQSDPARSRATSFVGNGKEPAPVPGQVTSGGLTVPPALPSPRQPSSPAVASGSGGAAAPNGGEAGKNRLRKRSQTPATRPPSTGQALITFDEEAQTNFQSPLARLFSSAARRPPRPIDFAPSHVGVEEALIGIRRLEGMVEGLKEDKGTVNKIRSDMKELQVRCSDPYGSVCGVFISLTVCAFPDRNDKHGSKTSS
jgi:hypothetical protein